MGKGQSQVPLISVIVPAYNHERYVEMAIRSVMVQDWPRIELLVVDDGSADGTWDVLLRLRPECELRFERVEMETQPNQGTRATLKRLLSMARGIYVAMLASDDEYLPGALGAMAEVLDRDPGLGLVVGVNEIMDGNGRRCYWTGDMGITYSEREAAYRTFNDRLCVAPPSPDFGQYENLLRYGNHVPNGALIRKSCLDRTVGSVEEAPLEDYWIVLQLAKIARMCVIDRPVFRYRWHDANTIKQHARMERYMRLTLLHEERSLFDAGDKANIRRNLDGCGTLEARLSVTSCFRIRWWKTQFSSVRETAVFGRRTYRRFGDPRLRLLAVAHVFYADIWPELAACIRNLTGDVDLVVTYVDENAVTQARADFPEATFRKCENVGFDVWPFLDALQHAELDRYDLVVKLHTKRNCGGMGEFVFNHCRHDGSRWRDYLLSFCRTRKAWLRALKQFDDPSIGLVGDRRVVVGRNDLPWQVARECFDGAVEEMSAMGGVRLASDRCRYVSGTMFVARVAALRPLLAKRFSPELFKPSSHDDDTVLQYAHTVEHLLGFSALAAGLSVRAFNGSVRLRRIYGPVVCSVAAGWRRLCSRLVRSKMTEHRHLVKVLGIPVWWKRHKRIS